MLELTEVTLSFRHLVGRDICYGMVEDIFVDKTPPSSFAKKIKAKLFKLTLGWLVLAWLLSACNSSSTTPQYAAVLPTPTTQSTTTDYSGVPEAATAGVRRPTATAVPAPASDNGSSGGGNGGGFVLPPTPTPDLYATIGSAGSNQDFAALPTFGRPPDRDTGPTANVTQLNNLLGTPGPRAPTKPVLYYPTNTAGSRLSGQPSRAYPTPTLDIISSTQPRILDVRNTKVSFQNSYRFALVQMGNLQPAARLIFATANILSPSRTVWSFQFVWLEGNKAWKVIYDSNQTSVNINEMAPPGRLIDAQLIDMSRVLDSPALIDKAAATGLQVLLPIDIVNFQVEGLTHQPCFVLTNLNQGKQVVINAYTGAIIRNELS